MTLAFFTTLFDLCRSVSDSPDEMLDTLEEELELELELFLLTSFSLSELELE